LFNVNININDAAAKMQTPKYANPR